MSKYQLNLLAKEVTRTLRRIIIVIIIDKNETIDIDYFRFINSSSEDFITLEDLNKGPRARVVAKGVHANRNHEVPSL